MIDSSRFVIANVSRNLNRFGLGESVVSLDLVELKTGLVRAKKKLSGRNPRLTVSKYGILVLFDESNSEFTKYRLSLFDFEMNAQWSTSVDVGVLWTFPSVVTTCKDGICLVGYGKDKMVLQYVDREGAVLRTEECGTFSHLIHLAATEVGGFPVVAVEDRSSVSPLKISSKVMLLPSAHLD